MNTERRHELHENTLARELNTWGDRVRPYTALILGGVAVLLGIYIAAQMWNSYQDTRDQAAWDDYQLALFQGDIEQKTLRRLADDEDHSGTEMEEWALMGWADRQLWRASELYLSQRKEANNRLTDIIGLYEQMAENSSDTELSNRARLGLARAYEMKNNLEEARKNYQRVGGALADVAAKRLRDLESKDAAETVNWLATVTLPEKPAATGPGTPGSRPGFEATTPSTDAPGGAASTMEEILGNLGSESTGDADRYGAEESTPAGDAGAVAPAVEADAAKSEATPAEEPVADTPAETAPSASAPEADAPVSDAPAPAETPAVEGTASDAAAEEPAAAGASAPK